MPPPTSPYFHIEESPATGRRIHASVDIPAKTPLLTTSALSTYVIFREYKREVCHYCFAYEGGLKLKVWEAQAGLAWCSAECKNMWVEHWGGDVALDVWKRVESLVQKHARKAHKKALATKISNGAEDNEVERAIPPTAQEINTRWAGAALIAEFIPRYQDDTTPATKATKHVMSQVRREPVDSTTISHLVAGVLLAAYHPSLWSAMLELYPSSHPYSSTEDLDLHLSSYHHLLDHLAPLSSSSQEYITPDILRAVPSRDGPNSFGIRSLDDAGDEIFGYGVWPEASYWNHNCAPNVQKRRVGRSWEFWTSKEVKNGEELCITYLGGDEKTLKLEERRARLMKTWGFRCGCRKCVEEGGE